MDDELELSPEQAGQTRVYRALGVLFLLSMALPYATVGGVNVFLFEHAANSAGLEIVRAFWPAVVGVGFVALSYLGKLSNPVRAGAALGLFASLLLVGINPLSVIRYATPPIVGDVAVVRFGMLPGEFFPREGALHVGLLVTGLVLLAAGARYRARLQSSRMGAWILAAGAVVLLAYYAWPYGGRMPAIRNVALYSDLYKFGESALAEFDAQTSDLAELGYDTESVAAKRAIREGRKVGQLRFTAVYYGAIYFVPALLALAALPALWRSRYRGHRIPFARLAGAGASFFLLAFLLPLVLKDGERLGALAGLRELSLLSAFIPGLAYALALLLRSVLEPRASDDALPDDPLAWRDD